MVTNLYITQVDCRHFVISNFFQSFSLCESTNDFSTFSNLKIKSFNYLGIVFFIYKTVHNLTVLFSFNVEAVVMHLTDYFKLFLLSPYLFFYIRNLP